MVVYEDLGVLIPDGSSKATAVNHAKRWMQENGAARTVTGKQYAHRQSP